MPDVLGDLVPREWREVITHGDTLTELAQTVAVEAGAQLGLPQ